MNFPQDNINGVEQQQQQQKHAALKSEDCELQNSNNNNNDNNNNNNDNDDISADISGLLPLSTTTTVNHHSNGSNSNSRRYPEHTQDDDNDDHDHDRHRVLGTWPLAVMVFYTVSGGPWGIEPAVRAGGPFVALVGFLLGPLLWSVPESFMTAELGSTFPEASGSVAWIEEAFGSTTGFIAGYLTWVSGATDNAIYPVLFLDYVVSFFGVAHNNGASDNNPNPNQELEIPAMHRFWMLSCTSVVLAYINYRGIQVVGNMSIVICIISMSPFVLMCLWGIPQVDYHRWFQLPLPLDDDDDDNNENGADADTDDDFQDNNANGGFYPTMGGVLWRPFLNNLFWNLNSFDSASCFAGEVKDPARTFPRGMLLAIGMVVCSYFLPLLIALGATSASSESSSSHSQQLDWKDGYMTVVATNIGGTWLGAWTVLASGISNLALFQAEMTSDAFQVLGMAHRGMLPVCFQQRSPYGTPTYGIVLCTLVILVLMTSMADLTDLVEMLNFNYAITLVMEYAAFVKLRMCRPHLVRPYKVPLGTFGCVLMVLPPVAMTLLVMSMASPLTYLYAVVGCALGAMLFACQTLSSGSSFSPCATPPLPVLLPNDDDGDDESTQLTLMLPQPIVPNKKIRVS